MMGLYTLHQLLTSTNKPPELPIPISDVFYSNVLFDVATELSFAFSPMVMTDMSLFREVHI